MLTPKKLLNMVQRWQKMASLRRKRIMSVRVESTVTVASRGHVYVYAADQKRFMVPLRYLSSSIFQELFKLSEEEFGLPSDGPIVLPCDAACLDYVISLIKGEISEEMEKTVLASINENRCMVSPLHQVQPCVVYGF